jgi:hypothetical protein
MKPMFFGLDGVLNGIVPVPSKGFQDVRQQGRLLSWPGYPV